MVPEISHVMVLTPKCLISQSNNGICSLLVSFRNGPTIDNPEYMEQILVDDSRCVTKATMSDLLKHMDNYGLKPEEQDLLLSLFQPEVELSPVTENVISIKHPKNGNKVAAKPIELGALFDVTIGNGTSRHHVGTNISISELMGKISKSKLKYLKEIFKDAGFNNEHLSFLIKCMRNAFPV